MKAAVFFPFAGAGLAVAMAAVRLIRPQRKTADWIWVYGMATLAVEAILAGLVSLAHSRDAVFPFQLYRTLSVSLVPGIWLLFSFTFARGDAFEYLKSRPLRSLALVAALPIFAAVFRYHLIGGFRFSDPDSPLLLDIGWAGVIVYAALLVSSILIVMNLERTFRAAVGTIRWRIKFMLMGVGAIFIVRIYTSSQVLLFRGVDLKLELLNSVALIVAAALVARSFLRTRQFEVAVYPSQSVLQGSITVLLAGIYLVVVGILAKMAAYVGGDNEFALKAFVTLVSLVVFAIFLQSDRVRMHLRRFVSRNFQRPLYDYRTVWRKFTEGTASRVQKDELCRSLLKMLADIFQSLSVAIWLWDDNREGMELTASTFVSGEKMAESKISAATAATLKKLFESAPDALDLEEHRSEWAGELKDRHPSQFPNGGHRICVPLVTQGEVIGLITLGDRVGGVEFSLQDFDMLKCVADDAAARLRNAQLSQKLLQAKELEAFQTMAAFFVHDLKNAASTLNLMLQNLPDHFDDPAFREDALRGVSKSVDHINRLIGRLGMLRHESTLHPTPQDLNDVVTAGMESLEQAAGGALSKDLRPLPKVMLDREQFGKVVTNLVLNATEALGRGGNIRVETRREGHWAVLSVADNGAGMSPEFLAKGLFRPFQTTKKTGLGIGMFQSKMIVEGHGGRITVASELGKGTTFEVFLPLAPQKP